MQRDVKQIGRWLRSMLVPLLLIGLAIITLREPLEWWLQGEERYDQEALKEWLQESTFPQALPEVVGEYLRVQQRYQELLRQTKPGDEKQLELGLLVAERDLKRDQIEVLLKTMCDPVTKTYEKRLPLFLVIYHLTVRFDDALQLKPIHWDSGRPRQEGQYRVLRPVRIHDAGAWVDLQYQIRVYARQQYNERQAVARWLQLSGLAAVFTVVALIWIYLAQRRFTERERQRSLAMQQVNEAERLRLQEELRRQEAERRQEEAERTALELKSQLFANIGIMAGSYAHNIKNLLVRPNDLLGRCLDGDGLSGDQERMLSEVRQTLGTVTERLQQILQTVRRDPSRSELVRVDLNRLVVEMQRTWRDLAHEKWKLELQVQTTAEPLWIDGDQSHLQQAVENLFFNARDATFEMRNHLREQARKIGVKSHEPRGRIQEPEESAPNEEVLDNLAERREALISAAGWRGVVVLRTRREPSHAVLEVEDNGIGMTKEVRRRCTETHFSTKRNNALFAGLSAGMGLGLSFVVVIMEHHRASLEIESEALHGATFRVRFPLALTAP